MTTKAKKHKTGTAVAVRKEQLPAKPRSMIEIIADAARDKSVDPAKMREIVAIQKDLMDRKAAAEFGLAMKDAKDRIPIIVKDRENPDTRSRYASLEHVSKLVDPVIRENGFTLSYGMADSPLANHYRVTCQVRHVGGHVESQFIDLPADNVGLKGNANKTLVHGVGSMVSYARRYLKCMIFDVNVANQDDDGNAAGGKKTDALEFDDVVKLETALRNTDTDFSTFCRYYKIDAVKDLPKARLAEAMALLDKKAKVPA